MVVVMTMDGLPRPSKHCLFLRRHVEPSPGGEGDRGDKHE